MLLDFFIRFFRSLVKWASVCIRQGQGGKEAWEENQRKGQCSRHMKMTLKWLRRTPWIVTSRKNCHGILASAQEERAFILDSGLLDSNLDCNESIPAWRKNFLYFIIQCPEPRTTDIWCSNWQRSWWKLWVTGGVCLAPIWYLLVTHRDFWSPIELVSWGCQNKLPQTEWHKTKEINFLAVLEAGSPNSRSCQSSFWWQQLRFSMSLLTLQRLQLLVGIPSGATVTIAGAYGQLRVCAE